MQKIITFLLSLIFSNLIFGQTDYEHFKKLYKDNDTTKTETFLAEWEKSNPGDPELYSAAFNFYFSNSKQETLSVDRQQHSKESFQLTDSTGAVAGFVSSKPHYEPGKLEKAFRFINKGIENFPNRLDLRFGKCYVLGQIADYENFTTEIIRAVEYSGTIKNNWLWTGNKPVDDAENFMLGTVRQYLKQLYDTEDDHLLENMKRIGSATIKYYPNNIEILSTTAVANILTKDYDKAIEYLKQAEKLNPKDFIILNNIAQGYKLKGDKVNAVKYYELTEKYGDEQAKQQARQNIEELRN